MYSVHTGVSALDQMLGGQGIPPGTIVLIRGGPGSGKTTLSLQMMAHHLRDPQNSGCYLSLESPPDEVIRESQRKFGFSLDFRRLSTIPRDSLEVRFYGQDDPLKRNSLIAEALSEALEKASDPARALVVIDSLNLFVDIVCEAYPTVNRRAVVHSACKTIQNTLSQAVVVITGEHDPTEIEPSSVAESFLCDALVDLTSEAVPSRVPDSNNVRLENRTFCRVLKSRFGRNQLRRCCYDIVPRAGLTFYETYPGDGRILLFQENEPQRAVVREFFHSDVPLLYPTLQCQTFERDNLHHVLGNQQRFQHIPERTDLYMASFDTYWINWYVERCQRELVRDVLQRTTGMETIPPRLVGAVQTYALAALADGSTQGAAAQEVASLEPRAIAVLPHAAEQVASASGQCGIFHMIDRRQLRLMGERRSALIGELENGPHRTTDPDLYRSVPYNFDVGCFVWRADKIPDPSIATEWIDDVRSRVTDICRVQREYGGGNAEAETKVISGLECTLAPRTWEEAAAICEIAKGHLVIESKTFDTTAVTLLEMIWAQGSRFEVTADHKIRNWEQLKPAFLRAFALLKYLFDHGITPRDSSIEPPVFCDRYNLAGKEGVTPPRQDWVLARHWYSTLVDLLTATKPHLDDYPFSITEESPLLWNQPEARLRICAVPTSVGNCASSPKAPDHVPCLGEWHLVILDGSENVALGHDLINWMTTSQGTCDWAFRGAILPTAKDFYQLYGRTRCFRFERPRQPLEALPDITFDGMRGLAKNARLRSSIYDYRRCMRPVHGAFEAIRSGTVDTPKQMEDLVEGIRATINKLAELEK